MKLKKTILILMICLGVFLFAGCSNSGTLYTIMNADGTIVENYEIPFAEQELINLGVTQNEILEIKINTKTLIDANFNAFLNAYYNRINQSEYSQEEKKQYLEGITFKSNLSSAIYSSQKLEFITYSISYENIDCYNEFKNANSKLKEDKEIIIINNVFTTTKKIVKDPVFDKAISETITLGQNCVNIASQVMQDVLGNSRWQVIKNSIGFDTYGEVFNYCYVVPTARIHSNADQVLKDQGNYCHFWEINTNNSLQESPIKIETWTIVANKYVWYITAIVGSVILMLSVYLKAIKQEKEKINKIKDKDIIM